MIDGGRRGLRLVEANYLVTNILTQEGLACFGIIFAKFSKKNFVNYLFCLKDCLIFLRNGFFGRGRRCNGIFLKRQPGT